MKESLLCASCSLSQPVFTSLWLFGISHKWWKGDSGTGHGMRIDTFFVFLIGFLIHMSNI